MDEEVATVPSAVSLMKSADSNEELALLIQTAKIPNALLFTGSQGSGRHRAAIHLFKSLNCLNRTDSTHDCPCDQCRSCMKIEASMHPDMIPLSPEKNSIKISQIRELSNQISVKPHEASIRMVFISDAHTMNLEAANALLKRLEEPPERTFFILLAPNLNLLLPTIISRCRHIRFKPIHTSEIVQRLMALCTISQEQATIIAKTSSGEFKKAMMLLNLAEEKSREENGGWKSTQSAKSSVPHSEKRMHLKQSAASDVPADWIKRRHWILSRLFELLKPAQGIAEHSAMLMAEKLSKEPHLLEDSFLIIKLWFRDMALIASWQHSKKTAFHGSRTSENESAPPHLQENVTTSLDRFLVNMDFKKALFYLAQTLPNNAPLTLLETLHGTEKKLQSNASARLILEQFFLSLLSPSKI